MRSILLYLFMFFVSLSVSAEDQDQFLTFSYWSEAGPPFVFLSETDDMHISSGILKDIAELISHQLSVSHQLNVLPRFVNIPVLRTESQLIAGEIDIDCITNPMWKRQPDQYSWSSPVFKGADRFLVRQGEEHKFIKFEDFKGKVLGIYNGYTYHPEIMRMIDSGDINTLRISGVDQGIKLLLLDRIDAIIDFNVLLKYKIKERDSDELALADLIAESYDLYCAYSKKSTFNKSQLNAVVNNLISSGEIKAILSRYE